MGLRIVLGSGLVALAVLTFTSRVHAAAAEERSQPSRSDRDSEWHLALGVDTDAPLDVGARIAVETPQRLRLSTSVGTTPAAYSGAIDGLLQSANAYDAATGALIKDAFQGTFVWRTHLGIRPVAGAGFYLEGGYTLVHLSASLDGTTLGEAAGVGTALSSTSFGLSTTLQMLDAEIGWEFPLAEGFRLRTAIGGVFTVGSSTDISVTGSPVDTTSATTTASNEVDHVFRNYGFAPLLTVGLDYRLF